MAENNFALIIVGIVAIVAVVGMLNFNGMTGKVGIEGRNVVQTATGEAYFTTLWECKKCDNKAGDCYNCESIFLRTTESGVSSYSFWECGDQELCHKLYYRVN